METYNINRYEEKSDQLFICISHTEKPVYIEHFFDESERKDEASRIAAIEKLAAELEIKADEYVEPEAWVSKVEEAKAFVLDSKKIAAAKSAILAEKLKVEEIK